MQILRNQKEINAEIQVKEKIMKVNQKDIKQNSRKYDYLED